MIKNRYETFEIISEGEIEKYKNMERNEITVSLITSNDKKFGTKMENKKE